MIFAIAFGLTFLIAFFAIVLLGAHAEPSLRGALIASFVAALLTGLVVNGAWALVSDFLSLAT